MLIVRGLARVTVTALGCLFVVAAFALVVRASADLSPLVATLGLLGVASLLVVALVAVLRDAGRTA